MYKIEIEDLGAENIRINALIKYLHYKDLYNLVRPYLNAERLSFGLRNNCPDGSEWGCIYSGDAVMGKIRITKLID